ncbi:hypothetical protein ACQV5M_19015, partial [Leptospira sp. SA-E8]
MPALPVPAMPGTVTPSTSELNDDAQHDQAPQIPDASEVRWSLSVQNHCGNLSMSTLAEQRTAILAVMQAVPCIGQVHDRERYSPDENLLRQFYLYTPPSGAATDA